MQDSLLGTVVTGVMLAEAQVTNPVAEAHLMRYGRHMRCVVTAHIAVAPMTGSRPRPAVCSTADSSCAVSANHCGEKAGLQKRCSSTGCCSTAARASAAC